jgi:hypothetical protein
VPYLAFHDSSYTVCLSSTSLLHWKITLVLPLVTVNNIPSMVQPFSTLPAAARISPKPFTVAIPKENLTDMETLIRLSKLAPQTYENSQPDMRYGVTTDWLVTMKDQWLKSYNW